LNLSTGTILIFSFIALIISQVLGQNIDTPKCWPHQRGFWEDVNVATCLSSSPEHIVPYDTRDPLGRERFHPFNPGNHLTYRIPPKNPDWYAKYNPNLKIGFECCSAESISFHYLPVSFPSIEMN
jgi:glycoprotein-N-acetylgalactosamine 3-beta-galactosyltransferase